MKSNEEKFQNVLIKNTFYFVNEHFENEYEVHVSSIKDRLLRLKNQIENNGLKSIYFEQLLTEENGLVALLALTGFSNESFKRILTVIRILQNDELNRELNLNKWNNFEILLKTLKLLKDLKLFGIDRNKTIFFKYLNSNDNFNSFNLDDILNRRLIIKKNEKPNFKETIDYLKKKNLWIEFDQKKMTDYELEKKLFNIINYCMENLNVIIDEWSDEQIKFLISNNKHFLKGLVNLFFKGSTISTLVDNLPLFELKKLSISKLNFSVNELLDSLVRYKEKGSYSGKKENNAEIIIEGILDSLSIQWTTGKLKEIPQAVRRNMDFIIPNSDNPKIIIESSFLNTTSSGQGDKAKTEIEISNRIRKHYPHTKFIGFVDGIGWYVRKGDLKRMVTAYEDVFTFHKDELERFKELLLKVFK